MYIFMIIIGCNSVNYFEKLINVWNLNLIIEEYLVIVDSFIGKVIIIIMMLKLN